MKQRISFALHLFFGLPLLLAWTHCQAAQPSWNLGTGIGIPSKSIGPIPIDSVVRAATAMGKTFQDITPEQEYYIGRSVAATILASYRPFDDEPANHYLNLVGQTVAQASDRPDTFGGYHFLILDSDEVNAFAAPGGLIFVTRGMMRLCKDEDNLAAVLAHEVGHIQGKHGLRAIKNSRLTAAFSVLASEGIKQAGGSQLAQLTEIFEGSVSDIAATLIKNGYSRDLEREADQQAVVILRRVGYDPGALSGVLSEMDKRMVRSGPGFAKTHPDPGERMKELGVKAGGASKLPQPSARKARFEKFAGKI